MAPSLPSSAADLLREVDVERLGSTGEGTHVSILLPTHRSGPETQQGPIRLKNLVTAARRQLSEQGIDGSEAHDLLAPVAALADDTPFWQHQSGGLALYRTADRFDRFRVPEALPEIAAVAGSFALRPLLPSVTSAESFVIVALSQTAVRVLEATEATVDPVEVADLPASMEEALAHEDPERQLQFRAAGGGDGAMFHGHGAGGEVEKAAVERFLRAVDRPLARHLAGTRRPVVLASVGYYGPIYRSVTDHPHVLEAMVEGNPDHRSDEELLAAAWPIAASALRASTDADLERLRAGTGSGKVVLGAAEVAAAASRGQVDCTFATPGPVAWGSASSDHVADAPGPDRIDLVGCAAAATLAHGGRLHTVTADHLPDAAPIAALLRY